MATIMMRGGGENDQKKKVVNQVKIASEKYNYLLKSVTVARNLMVPLETELNTLEEVKKNNRQHRDN